MLSLLNPHTRQEIDEGGWLMTDKEENRLEASLNRMDVKGWMQVGTNLLAFAGFLLLLHFRVEQITIDLARIGAEMKQTFTELRAEMKEDRYKGRDAVRDFRAVDLQMDALRMRVSSLETIRKREAGD